MLKNGAFENLNSDMRKGFEGDKQLLKNLLIDHLLVGEIRSGSLEGYNKTLSLTVSQKPIQLYRDQDMYVKDMVVKDKDMSADNGIIHGIDCVMFVQQSETDDRLTADIQDAYPVTACCLDSGVHDDSWRDHYSNIGRAHAGY